MRLSLAKYNYNHGICKIKLLAQVTGSMHDHHSDIGVWVIRSIFWGGGWGWGWGGGLAHRNILGLGFAIISFDIMSTTSIFCLRSIVC